jgi:hypothetical protein
MEPHWFGSLDPDPLCDKKTVSAYGSGLSPMRIQNTVLKNLICLITPDFSAFSQRETYSPFHGKKQIVSGTRADFSI